MFVPMQLSNPTETTTFGNTHTLTNFATCNLSLFFKCVKNELNHN